MYRLADCLAYANQTRDIRAMTDIAYPAVTNDHYRTLYPLVGGASNAA